MVKTGITKDYVIDILQMYKTSLIKEVGKNVHLVWKDNKIDWVEAMAPEKHFRRSATDELLKVVASMNDTVGSEEKQMANFTVCYAGGVVCKVVEEWLSWLENKEAEILFHTYINHDYERRFKRFRGLPETQIAKKMGISTFTVWACKKEAVEKVLDKLS